MKKYFAQAKEGHNFAEINVDGSSDFLIRILLPNNFLDHWQHKTPTYTKGVGTDPIQVGKM